MSLRPLALIFVITAKLAAIGCSGPHAPPGDAHAASRDPLQSQGADWFLDAGRQAAAAGDTSRAEEYLALALKKGAPSARVLPELLQICIAGSRLRAALNYAEPRLRADPHDVELRFLVATILAGLGQAEEAQRELERILELREEHAETHYLLGVLNLDFLGDPAAAQAHFVRYLALSPRGTHAAEAAHRLNQIPSFEEQHAQVVVPRRARAR